MPQAYARIRRLILQVTREGHRQSPYQMDHVHRREGFMKVRLPNGEKYDGVWLNGQMQRAFSIRNRRNAEPVYHFH